MHQFHGFMAQDGQSLNGVVYSQGDPISILDEELASGGHDIIRVCSLSTGQTLAVPSSSVFWMPANSSTSLPWTTISAATDVPELDSFSEPTLPSGLSSPSVASPLTPTASVSPLDILRRDSAISFCPNDEGDDVLGSNLHAGQHVPPPPFGLDAMAASADFMEHATMTDKLPAAGSPFLAMFDDNYSPWNSCSQAAAKTSTMIEQSSSECLQVNYMYMQSPNDQATTQAPHHEVSPPTVPAPQTWQQPPAMPAYDWQPQAAQPYSSTTPVTQAPQADIPRFHEPVDFSADPRQHFQVMNSLHSYDMTRAHGVPAQVSSTVVQPHQPTFYRAQEQQTMNLTEATRYASAPARPTFSNPRPPKSSSRVRKPEPEIKLPEEQALRPHIVLDHFRRQVQPDIDMLEAREREQKEFPTDEARARLVSEALALVRPAVADMTKVLESVQPCYTQPWAGTQNRLQNDAEQIAAMIQVIRKSALEESEVRQHEPRQAEKDAKPRKGLAALVQDYVDNAERVGRVISHGNRKEKTDASRHAAAGSDRSQQPGPVDGACPPSTGLASCDWAQGQTAVAPDQRPAALGHYHHQQPHYHVHQQQHQQHQQHQQGALSASPVALPSSFTNHAGMGGLGLHERPLLPAVSATPIADAAMATVMAPSGGSSGPLASAGWMAHPSAPPTPVGLGPGLQPLSSLDYTIANNNNNNNNSNTTTSAAHMYPSPPAFAAPSGQMYPSHPMQAAPSPFPGHLQVAMPIGAHDMSAPRRGSLPDRRLTARERAAPYHRPYRAPSERKGSV